MRHVIKAGTTYYILFNEEKVQVKTSIKLTGKSGKMIWLDQVKGTEGKIYNGEEISFSPFEMKILKVDN
ncbi:MAG: hypothetical protein U0X39_02050 [Bacteroidales bacterium]